MDRSARRAVLERLAATEEIALRTGSHQSVRAARTQLKSITNGWRELLLAHQPDRKDRCPVCSGWLRRRRWPCQVWVTAHEHLIGDGHDPARGSAAKKSDRVRRPRQVNPQPVSPRQVEVIPRQVQAPAAADHSGGRSPSDPYQFRQRRPVTERPGAQQRRTAVQSTGWTLPESTETDPVPVSSDHTPVAPQSRHGWRSRV